MNKPNLLVCLPVCLRPFRILRLEKRERHREELIVAVLLWPNLCIEIYKPNLLVCLYVYASLEYFDWRTSCLCVNVPGAPISVVCCLKVICSVFVKRYNSKCYTWHSRVKETWNCVSICYVPESVMCFLVTNAQQLWSSPVFSFLYLPTNTYSSMGIFL